MSAFNGEVVGDYLHFCLPHTPQDSDSMRWTEGMATCNMATAATMGTGMGTGNAASSLVYTVPTAVLSATKAACALAAAESNVANGKSPMGTMGTMASNEQSLQSFEWTSMMNTPGSVQSVHSDRSNMDSILRGSDKGGDTPCPSSLIATEKQAPRSTASNSEWPF